MTTSRVDERLRSEARRFRLLFTCEDCAHFAPETLACSHGFPTEPHRGIDLERASSLEFCKAFEVA